MADIRIRSLLKGLGSFVVPSFRNSHVGPGAVLSAETLYSIFLRYLSYLNGCEDFSIDGAVVVELGPGSSIGFGMAALLAGASRFYAFDHINHISTDTDLRVFDRLLELFHQKAGVPHAGKDAHVFPFLPCYDFPDSCLPRDSLRSTLDDKRVADIRQDIADRKGHYVNYQAPWSIEMSNISDKADLIVSNAVLEHVDDVELAYTAFRNWVKPGGYMAHLIDYGSHTLFNTWNGHWACSEFTWKVLRGKRHYLINRVPHFRHLELLAKFNFDVIADLRIQRVDGLVKESFGAQFRNMTADDANTHLAFLVSRAN
ncbi:MAG: methyltransferase domain-containing protein [Candidatus Acidiferrum sp.]